MKYCGLLLFLILTSAARSQYIEAGVVGINDNSWIPWEPMEFDVGFASSTANFDTIYVDVDLNGTVDVKFTGYYSYMSNWNMYKIISVEPMNGVEVAVGSVDSCFSNSVPVCIDPPIFIVSYPMARNYSINELIDHDSLWMNSQARMKFDEYNVAIPTINNCGYGCGGSYFQSGDGYVGLRRINDLDTGYAWIQVSNVSDLTIRIDKVAYNDSFIGITELERENSFEIYPNPARGIINLRLNSNSKEGVIRDLLGREVLKFNSEKIDVSGLNPGKYFIRIEGRTKAFIKQ